MKKLIILVVLLLPIIGFAQGRQRLGIRPTESPISITKSKSGSVKAFCSDGHARNLDDVTLGDFNYFQAPETIEIMADGQKLEGGINELIEKKYISVNTFNDGAPSDFHVEFVLSENAPYKNLTINFREGNMVADTKGDFDVANTWVEDLKSVKFLPNNVTSFSEAKPYFEKFQAANHLETSGMLTPETQGVLEHASERVAILQDKGYLTKDFSTYEEFQAADKQFKYDYAVTNYNEMLEISDYLDDKAFMTRFKQIKIDREYPGEDNIPKRNIAQIYYREPSEKVLSREIKTFDNHHTHVYLLHTQTRIIRVPLSNNSHTMIRLLRVDNAA